jgi:hypothetical protein
MPRAFLECDLAATDFLDLFDDDFLHEFSRKWRKHAGTVESIEVPRLHPRIASRRVAGAAPRSIASLRTFASVSHVAQQTFGFS